MHRHVFIDYSLVQITNLCYFLKGHYYLVPNKRAANSHFISTPRSEGGGTNFTVCLRHNKTKWEMAAYVIGEGFA